MKPDAHACRVASAATTVRGGVIALGVVFAAIALACSADPPAIDPAQTYSATIRRTSFGIPHIQAADLASLGFGEGYAFAADHLCSLADQVIYVRGERRSTSAAATATATSRATSR